MLKLENKNAMVTGGSAGIGLGCAKSFAADGANVLIMGRTADRLEKARDELAAIESAGDIEVFVGDAGRESDVEAAAQAAARGGVLDITVANAGMGILAPGLFSTKEIYNDYLECMPISRHGKVEDISQAVRFLCGPESSWITGVVMSVDGGHHLRRGPNLEPFARAIFGGDLVEGRILD